MGPNHMDAQTAHPESTPDADAIAAVPEAPAAILRGTARGLEVVIDGTASVAAITSDIMKRIDEAPAFFRGNDVRIRVESGPLPAGCLARLDELAMMFELRIVEVTAAKRASSVSDAEAVPEPNLAAGSMRSTARDDEAPSAKVVAPPAAPAAVDAALVEDVSELVAASSRPPEPPRAVTERASAPVQAAAAAPELPDLPTPGTRVFVGPVRSGVILEHVGHLIIFGDVNPGAEVRASGNIVVLGRLRGTAHAGIGQDVGFIMALRLEPQQLRIGRKVARAADSDKPASEPEIAYGTGDNVVVERYLGKLPRNLATSI